jgi:CRP-like cAMP-binding protein
MNSLFINLTDPVVFQSFGGAEFWTAVTFPAGSSILKEGEESVDFYYIFSGLVKINKSIKDEDQTQKHLATLSAGDFFGEGALLSDKGRSASAEAVEETKLLKLSQGKFEELVGKNPQAAIGIIFGIVRVLNARLQSMNERLVMFEHVSDLTRKLKGDLAKVLPSILKELETVLHHGTVVLFSKKGEVRYTTSNVTFEQLQAFSAPIPNLLTRFGELTAPVSCIENEHVYTAVRNLQGELKGVLSCQVCSACQEEDVKLFLSVAEQIGNLVE